MKGQRRKSKKDSRPVKSVCKTNKSAGKFSSAGAMFKFMGNGLN